MCGATSEQKQLQASQIAFYNQATQHAETTFNEDQEILKQMQGVYAPILAKGPNQRGFSDEERQNLDTQVTEGTAKNYQQAARAVNEHLAAQGGGNIPLTSGADAQLQSEVANASAAEQSRQESQVIAADYSQGHKQFTEATDALLAASHELNPTAYSEAATNAGSAAEKTANDIAAANNSWVNAALGAAGGIGSAIISENPKGIFS